MFLLEDDYFENGKYTLVGINYKLEGILGINSRFFKINNSKKSSRVLN